MKLNSTDAVAWLGMARQIRWKLNAGAAAGPREPRVI
jgi:hypothetical protein